MNKLPDGWDLTVRLDNDRPRLVLTGPPGAAAFLADADGARADLLRFFAEACPTDKAAVSP